MLGEPALLLLLLEGLALPPLEVLVLLLLEALVQLEAEGWPGVQLVLLWLSS